MHVYGGAYDPKKIGLKKRNMMLKNVSKILELYQSRGI
jgi:hypothetical protein